MLAAVIIFAIAGYNFLCALVLTTGMTVTLLCQLKTGYAFNSVWKTDISRKEKPSEYWFIIILNLIMILFFVYFSYLTYHT